MSDYLTNLAVRSVNLAEVIQPRLASRFEASRAHNALGLRIAVPSLMDEEVMTEAPAEVSVHLPQEQHIELKAAAPEENVLRTPRPAQTQISSPKARETITVAVPQQEERAEVKSETIGEPRPLARTALRERLPVSSTLRTQPRVVPPPGDDARMQNPADRVVLSPEVRSPVSEAMPQTTEPEQQPTRQPIMPPITRVVIERETEQYATVREQPVSSASHSVVVRPRVIPLERQREEKRSGGAVPWPVHTQPPAPTIHVTIGRVEVRATGPAAPAPKPWSAPQTMSLDEYLRKRSGGGRL